MTVAFPQDRLPIKQEMKINGVWTDITSRTRQADDNRVTIGRGYSSEQARSSVATGSSTFTVNNRDFFFSNRSPSSVNYTKVGRNTQYRTSITESTPWLFLADYSDGTGAYDGARAMTTDKASLDVTGDLDLRIDVRPDNWRGGTGFLLATKYNATGNQRSWAWWIDRSGYMYFRWTTAGTSATIIDTVSTVVVSALRRQALRVTLDVNNGAGGYTVTFYTSDTISGTWTQLGGQTVTTGGTTSVFAGTADLHVGTVSLGTGAADRGDFAPRGNTQLVTPFVGRVYRFQMYSGIAGTLVADMNAAGQAAGTTSWSDGLASANTWTLVASAEITAQNYRFWGEMPDMPQQWDVSGTDVYGTTTAYDILSRKQQGAKSLRSAIYRNLIRFSTASGTSGTLDGYWPMENGSQATVPSPAVGTFGAMSNMAFSTDDDFPGSSGVLTWSSDSGQCSGGGVPTNLTSNTGVITFLLYFRAPSIPAANINLINFYAVGGNSIQTNITVGTAAYTLTITDASGTVLLTTAVAFGTGGEPNQPLAMRVMLTQSGGNVNYEWAWYPIGGAVLFGVSGSYAGSIGRPGGRTKTWNAPGATGKAGWWISHVAVMREDVGWEHQAFVGSTNAYVGERCEARFARLCREENVPYWVVGRYYDADTDPLVGETMGPQTPQAFIPLLAECAALDRGLIYGPRDKFGIAFRLHNSLINRDCVELDYAQNQLSPPFVPRGDLFFAKNDVTVTNGTGGSARWVKTTGDLNTNEPEDDVDGIGTYDPGPITRIADDDDRLLALAQEEVFHGTWDELRYPNVTVERARTAFTGNALLDADVLDVDLGDAVRVANLPGQVGYGDVEMLAVGYTEVLANRSHTLSWNTEPYGPYRHLNDLSGSTLACARLAATNSLLSGTINDTATSFTVTTSVGLLWRTGSAAPTFPMSIIIGGEEMSVGQISGSTSPQTFSSVTRGVNGIAVGHASLSSVQVKDAWYVGRDPH